MELTSSEWLSNAGSRAFRKVAVLVLITGVLWIALTSRASAAVNTTTVQGTVYLANGQPGSGMLHVSWPAFTTANGLAIVADGEDVTIGQDGFLSVNLAPNLGAMPGGLYYTAVFYMSDGSVSTQYWVIPAAAQATLAQVQVQVMPAAQAVQAVNKAYVDQAIAQVNQSIAQTSQSVLTGSGGTLTGPLFLSGDPTQPLQAADKHYVDLAVGQAGSNIVNPSTPGQIAYYAQNGTSVTGMSTVPVSAGGTGSNSVVGAIQNLGGVSSTATSTQSMSGPLNLSAPYDSNATNLMQAATAQNVRNVAPRSVKEFGAKGNGKFSDFKMTAGSNVVQLVDVAAGYTFSTGDVGKMISLPKVDSDGKTLYTTITGYADSTHVSVALNAANAFDGTGTFANHAVWATDDLAAINAAISAASNLPAGAGSSRGSAAQVYFPCGMYGASGPIYVSSYLYIQGESRDCVSVMYMGRSTGDATIEVAANAAALAPLLRSNVYLTSNNHPEIGSCAGAACSPGWPLLSLHGSIRDMSIYGNKYTSYALTTLEVANYDIDRVSMYNENPGSCFYTLNNVETTSSNMLCTMDGYYGRGQPVNGLYTDGSGPAQGPIPFTYTSPWVSYATGAGMMFNAVGGGQVHAGQLSLNGKSLNMTSSANGVTFYDTLFEAGSTADVIAGSQNNFIGAGFTGSGLTVSGYMNTFKGMTFSSALTITGEANRFEHISFPSAGMSGVTNSAHTTVFNSSWDYGTTKPTSFAPMSEEAVGSAFIGSGSNVVTTKGTWFLYNLNTEVKFATAPFAVGTAWKAIFIGNWFKDSVSTSLPPHLEVTDASPTITVSTGKTITFSINSSGQFVGKSTNESGFYGFTGTVFIVPRAPAAAGSGGTESMSLANDLMLPSITLAGGTAMTANHGNGTRVQHSDGTGTSGPAFFDANGNVTSTASGTINASTVATTGTDATNANRYLCWLANNATSYQACLTNANFNFNPSSQTATLNGTFIGKNNAGSSTLWLLDTNGWLTLYGGTLSLSNGTQAFSLQQLGNKWGLLSPNQGLAIAGNGGTSVQFNVGTNGNVWVGASNGSYANGNFLLTIGSGNTTGFDNSGNGTLAVVKATELGNATNATIAAGAAAGTSPTIACAASHKCTASSGTITLTEGTSPTTGALLTITDSTAKTNLPDCIARITLTASPYTEMTSQQFSYSTTVATLNVGAALTAATQYTITYTCIGY